MCPCSLWSAVVLLIQHVFWHNFSKSCSKRRTCFKLSSFVFLIYNSVKLSSRFYAFLQVKRKKMLCCICYWFLLYIHNLVCHLSEALFLIVRILFLSFLIKRWSVDADQSFMSSFCLSGTPVFVLFFSISFMLNSGVSCHLF